MGFLTFGDDDGGEREKEIACPGTNDIEHLGDTT